MSDTEGISSSAELSPRSIGELIESAAATNTNLTNLHHHTTSGHMIIPSAAVSPFVALTPSADATFTDFPRVSHSFGIVHGQVQSGLERLKTVAEFIGRNYASEE